MKESDDNTPSWLKEAAEQEARESSPLISSSAARDVENNVNEPSWLRESNQTSSSSSVVRNEAPRSARKPLKWKKPESLPTKLPEVEEDCCCCPSDPVLYWFYMYHFVTGLAGLLAAIANISVIVDSGSSLQVKVLHFYLALFSSVVIAVETDFKFLTSRLRLLELWLFRGLFYTFVGFSTCAESDVGALSYYADIVGAVLFLLGLGYAVMGMFCLRSVLSSRLASRSQSADHPSHSHYTEIIDDFAISPIKT